MQKEKSNSNLNTKKLTPKTKSQSRRETYKEKKWKGMMIIKLKMMVDKNTKRLQHPCGNMWQGLGEEKWCRSIDAKSAMWLHGHMLWLARMNCSDVDSLSCFVMTYFLLSFEFTHAVNWCVIYFWYDRTSGELILPAWRSGQFRKSAKWWCKPAVVESVRLLGCLSDSKFC